MQIFGGLDFEDDEAAGRRALDDAWQCYAAALPPLVRHVARWPDFARRGELHQLRRQVEMWRARCSVIVDMEKAALDNAMRTAFSRSAPPLPPSATPADVAARQAQLAVLELEHSGRRGLQTALLEWHGTLLTLATDFTLAGLRVHLRSVTGRPT